MIVDKLKTRKLEFSTVPPPSLILQECFAAYDRRRPQAHHYNSSLTHTSMGASISCLRALWGSGSMTVDDKIDNKRQAMIISGFCAIGKTHFLSQKDTLQCDVGMKVYDLDSSAYSSEHGFPHNYLSEIRKRAQKPCIILISTHGGVPTQLAKDDYYVALVYPGTGPEAKREWLRRLQHRGREQGEQSSLLYELTNKNWDLWYKRTAEEEVTSRWTLSNNPLVCEVAAVGTCRAAQ